MNRGSLFWGLMLVVLGGLLLMQTMGLLPQSFNVWSIFWPLLLIFLGVGALLRATGRSWRSTAAADTLRLPLEGCRRASIKINHGAGELLIDDRASTDELINGSFVGGVDHQVRRGVDDAGVVLKVPSQNIPMFSGEALNWTVGLNPNIPISLDLEVGASKNILNLTNLQVKGLKLQTGASATEISLPARAGETQVEVHSGMAGVDIRVPDGVSARIRARGGLYELNVDTNRFPNAGGEYRSPDYDMAANRVDIDVETGMGGIKVH
jgi:hypothetical protein